MDRSTPEKQEGPLEVELPLRVGTYDIDYAGIVSNITYLRWLEDLRTVILEEHLPLKDQIEQGLTPVLVSTEIQYLRPLRLFDKPTGHMWISDVGRARWSLEAEILLGDRPVARAKHVLASVSLATFRPQPLPPRLRELFNSSP